ncbi:MAG: glycosyltransferase family 4 protein [Thermoleophilia bacterium]|nr:glycosyltransferase family 4 protein [Thermoleophilia bacterium]
MRAPVERPRLLVVNQYYRPGIEATARVLTELCEALADEWEITVVAGTVAGAAGAGRERRNGVHVRRVASTAFARRRRSLRALNYLSYLLLALAAGVRERRPDVVLAMTDPPLVGAVAAAVARRHRAPLVAVSQDVFPEVAEALGQLARPAVAALLRRLAAVPLRRAERVVAIGETMRARLEMKGVPAARLAVIPNWVDTGALRPAPRRNAWAREHGLEDAFVVMHSGNLGYAQDLETLVRAAALLGEEARVVVVGGGARRADLAALARRERAPVRFLPYQPTGALPLSLSAADVHAVGLARGLAGLVVPSRIYGILAVGRPVVVHAEEESETAQLVRQAGCGLVVPPGEPEALAAAVREARTLDLDELGRRAREWVVAHGGRDAAVARYRALLAEVRSAAGAR